jgi:hypothetical protein
MAQSVPGFMEGRVLEEALLRDYSAVHPIRRDKERLPDTRRSEQLSDEELRDVLERLHGLGYV